MVSEWDSKGTSGSALGNDNHQEMTTQQAMPSTATVHLKRGGFISCQTTELCDAILEGYLKSKKQFFVSNTLSFVSWALCPEMDLFSF